MDNIPDKKLMPCPLCSSDDVKESKYIAGRPDGIECQSCLLFLGDYRRHGFNARKVWNIRRNSRRIITNPPSSAE